MILKESEWIEFLEDKVPEKMIFEDYLNSEFYSCKLLVMRYLHLFKKIED